MGGGTILGVGDGNHKKYAIGHVQFKCGSFENKTLESPQKRHHIHIHMHGCVNHIELNWKKTTGEQQKGDFTGDIQ